MNESVADRLWSRVIKHPGGCWEWQGNLNHDGYGDIRIGGGKRTKVHRVAYELCVGPIPEGALILHKCDNPRCVNPDHLYAGTQLENMHDRLDRHRNPRVRLTKEQVEEIRQRYVPWKVTTYQLAKEYGVSAGYIWRIIAGQVWQDGEAS